LTEEAELKQQTAEAGFFQTASTEWAERIVPEIEAAVREANQKSMELGIKFAIRQLTPSRLLTPKSAVEFPGLAIEQSSDVGARPRLEVRLDFDKRVMARSFGLFIKRDCRRPLNEFDSALILDTVLEFTEAAIRWSKTGAMGDSL
jgi:hypothetical protein